MRKQLTMAALVGVLAEMSGPSIASTSGVEVLSSPNAVMRWFAANPEDLQRFIDAQKNGNLLQMETIGLRAGLDAADVKALAQDPSRMQGEEARRVVVARRLMSW